LLAKQVAAQYDGRVVFRVEDFGNSPVADKLGVDKYPAIFIDDVLVATPDDFYDWEGQKTPGRYTPWREQAGRDRFVADLRRMVELRLNNGDLEGKTFNAANSAKATVRLPDLTLQDLAGNALTTGDLDGQVVVVEFWASWCPPCAGTIEWLPRLGQKHGDDVTVLALAVQSEEEQVRSMVAGSGEGMRVAMVSLETTEAFGGVMAVPTLIVFDQQGRAASVFYGAPPDLKRRVDEAVTGLLQGGSRSR
jgi:thiol-disulfide isomerase/thioredoxin